MNRRNFFKNLLIAGAGFNIFAPKLINGIWRSEKLVWYNPPNAPRPIDLWLDLHSLELKTLDKVINKWVVIKNPPDKWLCQPMIIA